MAPYSHSMAKHMQLHAKPQIAVGLAPFPLGPAVGLGLGHCLAATLLAARLP